MKQLIITRLFMTLVLSLIGYFLFKEIIQEKIRLDACNNYSLSVEQYNLLCKQPK